MALIAICWRCRPGRRPRPQPAGTQPARERAACSAAVALPAFQPAGNGLCVTQPLPTRPSHLPSCRALGFFAVDGSGLRLLRASGAATLAEAEAQLRDARRSDEMLRCLTDWLRLLVGGLACGAVGVRARTGWQEAQSGVPCCPQQLAHRAAPPRPAPFFLTPPHTPPHPHPTPHTGGRAA